MIGYHRLSQIALHFLIQHVQAVIVRLRHQHTAVLFSELFQLRNGVAVPVVQTLVHNFPDQVIEIVTIIDATQRKLFVNVQVLGVVVSFTVRWPNNVGQFATLRCGIAGKRNGTQMSKDKCKIHISGHLMTTVRTHT